MYRKEDEQREHGDAHMQSLDHELDHESNGPEKEFVAVQS